MELDLQFFGGRGASASGGGTGFSYTNNRGRKVTVQKTAAGVVLVDGKKSDVDYNALLNSAKENPSFKKLSKSQLAKNRTDRYNNYNANDYELGGGRGKSKTVYRPRRNT